MPGAAAAQVCCGTLGPTPRSDTRGRPFLLAFRPPYRPATAVCTSRSTCRERPIDLDGSLSVQHTLEEIDGKHRLEEPKSAKGRRRIDLQGFAVQALWGGGPPYPRLSPRHGPRRRFERAAAPAGVLKLGPGRGR
jgi:hypothetical protein